MWGNLCVYLPQEGIKTLEKKVTALEIVGKEGSSHKWQNISLKCAASHTTLQKFLFKLPIPLTTVSFSKLANGFFIKKGFRGRGQGKRAVVKNTRYLWLKIETTHSTVCWALSHSPFPNFSSRNLQWCLKAHIQIPKGTYISVCKLIIKIFVICPPQAIYFSHLQVQFLKVLCIFF